MANVRVTVPQTDGEIRIATNGDEATTYKVSGGQVSVPEESLSSFLATVEGSEPVAQSRKEG